MLITKFKKNIGILYCFINYIISHNHIIMFEFWKNLYWKLELKYLEYM